MSAASVLRRAATPKNALAGTALAAATCGTLIAAAPAQGATTQASSAKAVAKKMIGDDAQYQCFSEIVEHESDWDVNARNASSGAYGLVQALPGAKMASAGADWKTNAATQIEWGLDYMKDRYGSACGAWDHWQSNHSY